MRADNADEMASADTFAIGMITGKAVQRVTRTDQ